MAATSLAHPQNEFLAHPAPVNHVVLSRDGLYMATADTDMLVRVWSGREVVQELNMHSILDKVKPTERVRGLRFSNDGQVLYVAAGECLNAYAVLGSTEPIWSYVPQRLFGFLIVSPTTVAVLEDGVIVAAFDNGQIGYFNPDGSRRAVIKHNAAPRTLQAVAGQQVVGTDGFSVTVWAEGDRKPVKFLQVKDRIYGMSASPNGKAVAVRHLFDTEVLAIDNGAQLGAFRQGRGLPLVAFSPDSSCLAIGTQHAIDLHAIGTSTASGRLMLMDAELISVGFSPDGAQVFAGCSDGKVRVWENSGLRQV